MKMAGSPVPFSVNVCFKPRPTYNDKRIKKTTVDIDSRDLYCGSYLAQGLDTVWINTCHRQGHWFRGEAQPLDPDNSPDAERTKLEHLACVEGPTFVLLG